MCRKTCETCETCRETAVRETADVRASRSQDATTPSQDAAPRRPRTPHAPSQDVFTVLGHRLPSQDVRTVPGRSPPSQDATPVSGRFLAVPGRSSLEPSWDTCNRPRTPRPSWDVFQPVSDGEAWSSDEGDSGRVLGRPRTPHPSQDAARRPGTLVRLHPSGTPPKLSRDARAVPGRANPSQDAQTVPGHAQASRTHRHNVRPGGASWDAHARRPRTPHLVPGRASSLSDRDPRNDCLRSEANPSQKK
jgi:hypothetical protein